MNTSRMVLLGLALLGCVACEAAVPEAARNDPRFELGYVVVTHYPGVRSDGTGDSTAGIQRAIDDAWTSNMAVFFPEGTYLVTDTLRCYQWLLWNPATGKPHNQVNASFHILVGSAQGASRPVIKLAGNAPLFDHANKPRPIVNYRLYRALNENGNSRAIPDDPMEDPDNFVSSPASLFNAEFRGIDLDCNSHAGAIGIYFKGAQRSLMADVKVNATGAHCGIDGLPGRNSGGANLDVTGGEYGLRVNGSVAGSTTMAVRLIGQTRAALYVGDFCPLNLVGFEIDVVQGAAVEFQPASYATRSSTLVLSDGTIRVSGGTALVNPEGKNVHYRNVYVQGTSHLIQSGGRPVISGSGTWKRIVEYTFTDQLPASQVSNDDFESWVVRNGVVSREPEPDVRIEAGAPPADLLTRHNHPGIPVYEGQNDGTIVITRAPYSATRDDGSDDRAAIQRAIDDASAAGHGRVFVPKGAFRVGGMLELRSNTAFFGVAKRISVIGYHESWRPTSGQVFLVRTPDDAQAATFLGFMELDVRNTGGAILSNGAYEYDRFGHLHWRAGRHSWTMGLEFGEEWHQKPTNARDLVRFSGHGGGRHFWLEPSQVNTAHPDRLCARVIGTSEPLWFYGLNMETTKRAFNGQHARTNCEIVNSRNVIIHGIKREGSSPSLIVKDSQNVAFLGSGAMRGPAFAGSGGYIQVLGSSDRVLVTTVVVQSANASNGEPLLREKLTSLPEVKVAYPNNVSLYKRGVFDESALYIGPGLPPRPPAGLLEAEDAVLNGCNEAFSLLGFTGRGYAANFNVEGDTITFHFDAAAGETDLIVRYQCHDTKTARLEVNGASLGDLRLGGEGIGEQKWVRSEAVPIQLVEGANTLRLTKVGDFQLHVDHIVINARPEAWSIQATPNPVTLGTQP